jgi:hypothetical protein
MLDSGCKETIEDLLKQKKYLDDDIIELLQSINDNTKLTDNQIHILGCHHDFYNDLAENIEYLIQNLQD